MRQLSILFLVLAACGDDGNMGADNDPFDTFQLCYNEHHVDESFTADRAIEICCIDHPIGGAAMNTVCGDTTDSCEAYVTANLTDASDPTLTDDITAACTNYPGDSGRGG